MIASVFAQSFQDWELVIVDDGSTEDIPAVIAKFHDPAKRVRYHRFDENQGVPHGMNWALQHALGDYVQPLSTDELLVPSKLKIQSEYLDEHENVQAVFGLPGNGETGKRPDWEQYVLKAHNRSREQWLSTLLNLEGVPIGGAGALWRRSVHEKIGYFDPKLRAFTDHEWFVRFFEQFNAVVLPYRWALCRPNPGAISSTASTESVLEEIQYVHAAHPLKAPNDNGLVTICIPCFNHGKYIRDAIDSVRAQTYPKFELLLVDDCSTDDSAEVMSAIIKEYDDRRISMHWMPENGGAHKANNYAMEHARGDYFVTLAADDTIEPDFLQKCLSALSDDARREFVVSQTDFRNEDLTPHTGEHPFKQIERPTEKTQQQWIERLYHGNVYFGVGLYLTQTLLELGGWDQQWGVLGDYEMYLRLVHRWNITVLEEDLTHTRIHDGQQSAHCDAKWLRNAYASIREMFYRPRQKVIIATAFYECRGFSPYIASMCNTVRLLTIAGIEHEFMEVSGDAYVDRAKNTIINRFLDDSDATDLFMIDSDMSWNAEAVFNMLNMPEEIVVGSYPMKNNWATWTSMPRTQMEEDGKTPYTMGRVLQDGSGLLEGGALAGGFMRFKRKALEKYREHFKDLTYTDRAADPLCPERVFTEFFTCERYNGQRIGEDRVFSRRLQEMGMKWYIYTNIHIGHFGMNGWFGNFDEYLRTKKQVASAVAS